MRMEGHRGRAFFWFFGGNDLSVALVDSETGSLSRWTHPDRAMKIARRSVVSYLLALAEMRQLARANINPTNPWRFAHRRLS